MFKKLAIAYKLKGDEWLEANKDNKCECSYPTVSFRLPVEKVDNIPVSVEIQYDIGVYEKDKKSYKVSLKIISQKELTYNYTNDNGDDEEQELEHVLFEYNYKTKNYEKPSLSDYENFFDTIYKTLPKLKYDKLTEMLTDKPSVDCEELSKLLDHKNIEKKSCCVCLDMCGGVIQKKECIHTLCLECFSKMKPVFDEDEYGERIHCPLCRQSISRG
jgi:hypothetical protein